MALRWFMGLDGKYIWTWADMKQQFLTKYKDYCKSRYAREEVFKMSQKEVETPEDFLESFNYALQWATIQLDEDIQKNIFLKRIREECMEILNLMCGGDISQRTFRDVKELCRGYSQGLAKEKTIWELGQTTSRTTSGQVS